MSALPLFDAAGRRRSPATMPGYHAGREPRNKGRTYPADPPTVDEIVAVMRHAGEDRHGLRARALIIVLWRAALRIQEALALIETDLDANRCSVLVQHGKGGHRREVGMDVWAWGALRLWLTERAQLPVGPLFCVIDGPTRVARAWSSAAVRAESAGSRLTRASAAASRHISSGMRTLLSSPARGCRCRFCSGSSGNMATTSTYLSGIGTAEVIATVASRPAPMMSATAGLEL